MSESSLVTAIQHVLKRHGCVVIKIHGTQYARKGEPDLVGSAPGGLAFAIEVKLDYNSPTAIQTSKLKEWRKAGASVGVARSVEEAIAIAIDRKSQSDYDPE